MVATCGRVRPPSVTRLGASRRPACRQGAGRTRLVPAGAPAGLGPVSTGERSSCGVGRPDRRRGSRGGVSVVRAGRHGQTGRAVGAARTIGPCPPSASPSSSSRRATTSTTTSRGPRRWPTRLPSARTWWSCPSTSSTAGPTPASGPPPDPSPAPRRRRSRPWRASTARGSSPGATPRPPPIPIARRTPPCSSTASGRIAATYRKLHLFDVAVDDGPADTESARVLPGDRAVVADVEGIGLGLSICYDLRFPELYRALALAGAAVLAVPAVFTERTGRDHWEVLLRARAIENGAWVIAAAGCGRGGPGAIPAWGHSMVVDPWGRVVAEAGGDEAIVRADLDLGRGRGRPAPDPRPRQPPARGVAAGARRGARRGARGRRRRALRDENGAGRRRPTPPPSDPFRSTLRDHGRG